MADIDRVRISQRRVASEFEVPKIEIDRKANKATVHFTILDADGAVIRRGSRIFSTKGVANIESKTIAQIATFAETKAKKYIEDNL